MGLKVTDESGNQIELPVDKVEDLATLKERADKVEQLEKDINPDWKTARQKMGEQETVIKTSNERIADLMKQLDDAKKGSGQQNSATPPLTAEEIDARSKKNAEAVYDEKQGTELEKNRQKLLTKLAGGDEQRKKAIDEKYKELIGGRTNLTAEEIESKMDDAEFLVNRHRTGNSTINRINGGAPNGGVDRANAGQREKAVSNLEAMGYRFKGDKSKLINRP